MNSILLTGKVSWLKKPDLSRGFGSVNTKVDLPKFEYNIGNELVIINKPFVWLNIKVSTDGNGAGITESVINNCESGKYIIAQGKASSYATGTPPEDRFSIDANMRDVSFYDRQRSDVNMCTFIGEVIDRRDKYIVLSMKTTSRSKAGTKVVENKVPILTDEDFSKFARVLVIGKICAKSPNETITVTPYVVPETIIKL